MTYAAIMDEWWLDDDRQLTVGLVDHAGRWRVDVRVWFRAEDGSKHAGRNGIGLSVRHLERLKAHRGAVTRFLIPPPQPTESECAS
jgi:Transcriptional Coactivator p15 (PC4)